MMTVIYIFQMTTLVLSLYYLWLLSDYSYALFGGDLPPGSECSVCPPGYGVTRICDQDAGRDTECQRCPEDTFNAKCTATSQCQPCTTCASAYFAWRACSPFRDAVCLPCSIYEDQSSQIGLPPDDEDYRRKCESMSTTEVTTAETTAEQPEDTSPEVVATTSATTTSTLSSSKTSTLYATLAMSELYTSDSFDYFTEQEPATEVYNLCEL